MIPKADAEKMIVYFNTIGSPPPTPVDIEYIARTVIALWDRAERLQAAGAEAAAQLRVIAGMDLIGASAAAYNAVRPLEAVLKETTNDA